MSKQYHTLVCGQQRRQGMSQRGLISATLPFPRVTGSTDLWPFSREASGSTIGSTSTSCCRRHELSFWQGSNGNHLHTCEECQALIQPYFKALAPLKPDSKQGCAGMPRMGKQCEVPPEHTGPEAVSRTGIRCHQRESRVVLLTPWPLIGFKEWDQLQPSQMLAYSWSYSTVCPLRFMGNKMSQEDNPFPLTSCLQGR